MRATLAILLLWALPALGGREFVAASSQLGIAAIDPVSVPITLHIVVNPRSNTQASVLLALNSSTNATELQRIFLNGIGADVFGLSTYNSAGSGVDTNGGAFVTNAWYSVTGVFSSDSLRTLYISGNPVATNTTSMVADGLDRVVLGAVKYTSYINFLTGILGEASVWDVALTASEILSLSQGASPIMIRPASLKFHAPLTGRETTSEWNLIGSAVSLTNSPTASAFHPRIYRP